MRSILCAAVALAALGCTTTTPNTEDDAGQDEPEDGGHDTTDAFVPGDGGGVSDAGPPAVWTLETCSDALGRGRSGDPCSGGFRCSGLGAVALCDLTDRLVVFHYDALLCESAAPAAISTCELALAGSAGQRCEGSLECIEVDPSEPCCVEIALCNPQMFPGGSYPVDMLHRARICDSACVLAARDGRPSWTECPPVWESGDDDPLTGDPCEGTWACMAGPERFGSFPGLMSDASPVWCDGGVLRVAPDVAALSIGGLPTRCE